LKFKKENFLLQSDYHKSVQKVNETSSTYNCKKGPQGYTDRLTSWWLRHRLY